MYSSEIKKLLERKKYLITTEEYKKIVTTSPQIIKVTYIPTKGEFEITMGDTNECLYLKLEPKNKNA